MNLRDTVMGLGLSAMQIAGEGVASWAEAAFQKAEDEGPKNSTGGSQQDSAKSAPVPTEPAKTEPKTLFFDPFAIIEQLGYKDRPTQITYGTLKAMVWKSPVLQAIIQTRINQIAAFSQPQHDRYSMGFRLQLREQEKEPTGPDKKWVQQMESVMTRTGVTENPRGRDNMETFLRKLCWDTLVYDQMCFETVPNRKGVPAEWYAVDAATIRIADSAAAYRDEDDTDQIRSVQIYDGVVIAEYTQEELCFAIRNPRNDIRLYGYGVSELEMLIPAVTSLLWAWEYNQKFFSQGSAAKGIINFKGTVPDKMLKDFRRHWYTQISSVANAWRTPITNADDLQYINLQQNSRDMEFNAWMDFLIKVCCGAFAMDPLEINFKYGNAGQRSGLQEASNKEKITESKERGLRPLLRFFESTINRHIVWPINENFELKFVGLDAKTRDDIADLNGKRVKTYMTVDELRAEDDLESLPDGTGEVILDPTWLQAKQGAEAAEQGGLPGEEGDGEDAETYGDTDFEAMLAAEDDEDADAEEDDAAARAKKEKAQGGAQKSLHPYDIGDNRVVVNLEF